MSGPARPTTPYRPEDVSPGRGPVVISLPLVEFPADAGWAEYRRIPIPVYIRRMTVPFVVGGRPGQPNDFLVVAKDGKTATIIRNGELETYYEPAKPIAVWDERTLSELQKSDVYQRVDDFMAAASVSLKDFTKDLVNKAAAVKESVVNAPVAPPKYPCPFCDGEFDTKEPYRTHIITDHLFPALADKPKSKPSPSGSA
jgi:hypothetical protein